MTSSCPIHRSLFLFFPSHLHITIYPHIINFYVLWGIYLYTTLLYFSHFLGHKPSALILSQLGNVKSCLSKKYCNCFSSIDDFCFKNITFFTINCSRGYWHPRNYSSFNFSIFSNFLSLLFTLFYVFMFWFC